MRRRIGRLVAAWIAGCALLALATTYHMMIGGDRLASDQANPRVAQLRGAVHRGSILTSDGHPVASSPLAGGARLWHGPDSLAPVVGYVIPALGVSGLESACDGWLSGLRYGFQRTGILSTLTGTPARGYDVVLTVHSRVQQACERALAGRRGAAVVLDAATGDILAVASSPWATPAQIEAATDAVMAREDSPLLSRALCGVYVPGSCIKPAIAAAAIDEGLLDPAADWLCQGWIRAGGTGVTDVPGGHGTLSLEGALALSCNTFFVELALSAGARLRARLERMGLDSGIDLQLPTARARLGDGWHTPEGQAQAAIGQGDMLVTPLHMAALYAAFANGGVLVRPNLIRKVTDAHGRTVRQWRPDAGHRVIGRDAVSAVEVGLLSAVEWGTASLAANPGRQVFGKTGTAENPAGAPHAWFCGYVRTAAGTAALSIVIENGGSGGAVAAPLARDIIQSLLAFYEGR